MKTSKILLAGAFAFVLSAMFGTAMAADTIDADDFVEDASAKGLAEIETSKLALQKSTAADVRAFAQQMIEDHTAANKELAAIAARKNLEVSDDAELMNKAKEFILKQRDGESFDEAFANNQVNAHQNTIDLFQQASVSKDADLAAFATKTLPKLKHHLQMAKALQKTYHKK